MRILCDSCKHPFDLPLTAAGTISYAHCKNVFRVTYRFRTPCPSCHQILQLVPYKKDEALGVSIKIEADEKTESVNPTDLAGDDRTIPKTQVSTLDHEPAPTVRVKPQTVRSQRFQFIERPRERPRPVHVPIRGVNRSKISLGKMMVFTTVALCTSLTIALTVSALRNGQEPPAKPAPSQESVIQAPTVEIDEPDPQPTPRVLVTPPPRQKTLSMKLPSKSRLSSTFGRRTDPFTGEKKFHAGIDFAEPKRAEVQAALAGKVNFVGEKDGYGRVIILEHADGYQTLYAHLTKSLVRQGSRVKQGELIGLIGETGRATAPHLHFELRKNGKQIDPLRAKALQRAS